MPVLIALQTSFTAPARTSLGVFNSQSCIPSFFLEDKDFAVERKYAFSDLIINSFSNISYINS